MSETNQRKINGWLVSSVLLVMLAVILVLIVHAFNLQGRINELESYKDSFPSELSIGVNNPKTGWQIGLKCSDHTEPNTSYAYDMVFVAYDKDFQGYRCNKVDLKLDE